MFYHTTSFFFNSHPEEFRQDFPQREDPDEILQSSHRTPEKATASEDSHTRETQSETDS